MRARAASAPASSHSNRREGTTAAARAASPASTADTNAVPPSRDSHTVGTRPSSAAGGSGRSASVPVSVTGWSAAVSASSARAAFSTCATRGGTAARSTSVTTPAWRRATARAVARTSSVSGGMTVSTPVSSVSWAPVAGSCSRETSQPVMARPPKRTDTREPGTARSSRATGTR